MLRALSPAAAPRWAAAARRGFHAAPRAASASSQLPSLTVVTPVTGHKGMQRMLRSVQAQKGLQPGQLRHLVFIDGPRERASADTVSAEQGAVPIQCIQLPYAVGRDGWLGHRMYGAAAFLCETDYLTYLDEDNWVDDDHAKSILDVRRKNKTFPAVWFVSLVSPVAFPGRDAAKY